MKEFNLETFKEIVSLSDVSCVDVGKNILKFVEEKYKSKTICNIEFDISGTYLVKNADYTLKDVEFFEVSQMHTTIKIYKPIVKQGLFCNKTYYSYSNEFKKDYLEISKNIKKYKDDIVYNVNTTSLYEGAISERITFKEKYYFVTYKSLFFETTFEEYDSILKNKCTELDKQSLVNFLENLKKEI